MNDAFESECSKVERKELYGSKIVGVSKYLPHNIWIMNFMSAQGYKMKKNILYEDNQNGIRMEKNGRNSCTGNSRHVDM